MSFTTTNRGNNDSGDGRQHLVSRCNDNTMKALKGHGLMGYGAIDYLVGSEHVLSTADGGEERTMGLGSA